MDIFAILGFFAVAGVVACGVAAAQRLGSANRLGRQDARRAIAESAGLTVVGSSSRHGVHARRGGLTVSLGAVPDAGGTRAEIRPIARGFSAWRVIDVQTRLSGVEIGDASFDAVVRFSGPALLVRALLDAETRDVARDAFLVDSSVAVRDGALTADFGTTWNTGQVISAERLQRLLALAERLQEPSDPVPRLVEIARSDREPVVRRSAVGVLGLHARSHPGTREAQRTACLDADPSVRLAGARQLGANGVPILEALARGGAAPDAIAAEAIEVLGKRLPADVLRTILDAAGPGRSLTAIAALWALPDGSPDDVARITAVLERASSGPAALAAVRALTRTNAPAAVAPLTAALGSDDEVAFAAAQGLAHLGTVDSVPALRAAEGRRELAHVAREAIVAIQSRLEGASRGQLALAGADGGSLAVAEPDGRVSLDPSDRAS